MTYHANARTNVQQRKRVRQSREPSRLLAKQLGVSVATVAKWRRRADQRDRDNHDAEAEEQLSLEGHRAVIALPLTQRQGKVGSR